MQRKAFNFYRSYYEVFKMLNNDKEKVQFITALLEKQFLNKQPGEMLPIAMFAYKSQEHSINAQIEGFINKTGETFDTPTEGGTEGGIEGASVQEKGEGKNWKQKMRVVWFKDENKKKIDEQEKIAAYNRDLWNRERAAIGLPPLEK